MEKVAQILTELVAIPSVNPAFLRGDKKRSGEGRIARHLADLASRAKLDVGWQSVLPGRKNLLVRLSPAKAAKQTILLAPHLDTVGGEEITAQLFTPEIRNGKLHGRGACDTKGSVAAMFSALLELSRSRNRPLETEIVFAGLVDEENTQEGSRFLARSGFKADLAIVGEPTECKVVTAHKGDLWLKLVTRGKAAHGARPELGRNAVLEMARVVQALETGYAEELKTRSHSLLGNPTINVGAIRGGVQPNIVPDFCEILVDRRTLPGEEDRAVEREILNFLKDAGCKAELANTKEMACPPLETSSTTPFLADFMRAARQKKQMGVDFFCDAAILAEGGIASVVFGPGDIAQAHTADEWISLQSLSRATVILTRFLSSLP